MLITDSRRVIEKMAEELLQSTQNLVTIDMQDIEKVLQYQSVKSLYIDGTMEQVVSTLNSFSTEFADAKLAVMQISTPTAEALKMQDVEDFLGAMRKEESRHFDIIWGISVKPEIPQGETVVFIVYAAD
ncbi:MAG: hypothetical protein E7139_03895 [Rikenellaceae bacterium]|nr:hypothetical protein [Rikenellaceae bacterium]